MVNVDRVYQRVLVLANKEQRGYITPQEFNLLANQAQMDTFEQYFYDLNQFRRLNGNDTIHSDIVTMLEEKISLFEAEGTVNRFDTNPDPDIEEFVYNLSASIPNLYRITNIRIYRNGKWRLVERVSKKDFRQMMLGPLTKTTSNRPVYTIDGTNNIITLYQAPPETITVDHIRRPNQVNWTFTMVGGTAILNDSSAVGYQDFDLHPSEETDLVMKILTLAGITIKDQGLYGIGAQEDNKNIQQEKQ